MKSMHLDNAVSGPNLRVEKQEAYRSTRTLRAVTIRSWLIYICVMLWVGRIAIFIRQREDYAAIDIFALVQIAAVMMILFFFLIFPKWSFLKQIQKSSLKFYFIYLVLGAVSALWSINPKYSLYRAVEALAMSAAVLYFCVSAMTIEECVRRVKFIMWPTLISSWIGLILFGGISLHLRLNGFGAIAALTATFFAAWIIADKDKQNRKHFFQMGLGLFLVFVSFSLASWWSFWFGICYCAFFARNKTLVIALIMIGLMIFFAIDRDTRQRLLLFDKQYENLGQMTGRKVLWEDYMRASKERPMIGFGFAMGAREVGSRYTTNTHNVFFAALMSAGWVGVVVLGFFFISLALEMLRYRHFRNPLWLACASALAAGCLNTMSVSILGEQFNLAAVVFVALLGLHLKFLQEAKSRKHKINYRLMPE